MCGRMNVIAAPITQYLREQLHLDFSTVDNHDLRPTQRVDTLMATAAGLRQITTHWGIQPNWSKRLLINAKIETAAEKPTFKKAFAQARCVIPVTGWYEWRTEGSKKQKYHFANANAQPMFMGGIVFKNEEGPRVVTFTTAPTAQCAAYHDRMPLIVAPDSLDFWLHSSIEQLAPLFHAFPDNALKIAPAP
ncbi:SOS response-associated peptidase [Pseudidiomarina sp.]|uniref:SOS response-associated peptidase n=1 Tax=Pseudidiomarina sp. TaxID=2081707 RepID=UPI003A96E2CE